MMDVQRDIGAHEEAIATLKDEVKALRRDIAEIRDMIAMSTGGVRMLISVAGVAASLGAGLAELVHWFHKP
jgi:hypothetical protein